MAYELLRGMRHSLISLLTERDFLYRDRGDALFITNAPIFAPGLQAIPGFILIPEGRLLRILPDDRWAEKLQRRSPPDHLSRSLSRFVQPHPEMDMEALRLFARGLKILDMGASASTNEINGFDRALRRRSALALRGACSGGGLYACAILNHQIQKGERI